MRIFVIATAVFVTLAIAAPAVATPPIHESFSVHLVDVDTQTCSFPVVRDWVFTQKDTAFFDSGAPLRRFSSISPVSAP